MIEFLDGPAGNKTLELRRAPVYLRVVIDADGNIDALDQLDDRPKEDERITTGVWMMRLASRAIGRAMMCVARARGLARVPTR